MTNVAFIVACLCTIVLTVLFVRQVPAGRKVDPLGWGLAAVGLLGGWAALQFQGLGPWQSPVAGFLFAMGVVLAILDFPDSEEPSGLAPALGATAVLVTVMNPAPSTEVGLLLGGLAGSSAAAAFLALRQRSRSAAQFTVFAAAAMVAVVLGVGLAPSEARQTVTNVIAAALVAILVGEALAFATKSSRFKWPSIGTGLAFAVMAYSVTVRTVEFPDLPLAVGGAALVALALDLVHRGASSSTATVLVGSLVWLGVATAAFSFARGYGQALAALVGLTATYIVGERRPAVWLSPVLALALYRLARFVYPDASKAFDIGQHYALVGLIIGLVVPLVAIEAGRRAAGQKPPVALASTGMAGAAMLVGTAAAVAFLGSKGASGMVIGFLVSPLLTALRGEPSKTAVSTGIGLAAWSAVSIGVFSTGDDLSRPEKVQLLVTFGLITAVFAVASWLLARSKSEKVVA